ncbi:hypothetical protein BBEV_1277 [Salisediminibacterium beveridgei]|uniref:Metallo-beta-lactamase domain-containing protein n=2 Tax=Salisediminibacterium beveridgei TaxID=632773 RepID=A0A1D7QUE6_9BACI|nr:hypothetical protein BBEV_1277 [Salisediminibacterium beveridgei]
MIDPGGEEDRVNALLQERSLKLKAIWLTHAHFDHIGAVQPLREKWDCPVYLHEEEKDWLVNPTLNGSGLFAGIEKIAAEPAEELIKAEGILGDGGFACEVYHTPGHSPGSVSFYFNEENVIFSGDVLFMAGVGRTDLPGGDQETLMRTIQMRMLTLPANTSVANGHGPLTTIGDEKRSNPFLMDLN